MGWTAIIATLLKAIGPLLIDWITKWLEGKLNASAAALGNRTFGTNEQALGTLLDHAISTTPRFAFARKSLLRRLKAVAVSQANEVVSGTFTLSEGDEVEIRDLASSVDNE